MTFIDAPPTEVGKPIPANTPHAVSVTLPSWKANVGYEEGADWVVNKMETGYPRFFVHRKIKELCKVVEETYGRDGELSFIFPTYNIACRCRQYIKARATVPNAQVRIVQLSTKSSSTDQAQIKAHIAAVLFPASEYSIAKQYWQHSGEGISSRLGQYFLENFPKDGSAQAEKISPLASVEIKEQSTYVEERFGRNLDLKFAGKAKAALKRRLATQIIDADKATNGNGLNHGKIGSLSEEDVFLYPTGMAAIFSAHRLILGCLPNEKSVCYGFPYADTLKVLEKFGPGAYFYGLGEPFELEELASKLESGEQKIVSLFCEFPSNPLLKTPDLHTIRKLADKYGFAVVVDETVGNVFNVDVLQVSDIVVSSLTKVFSGDSNVMGGSLVLNPGSKYYEQFKKTLESQYEDSFWAEDVIYLERNSRDFAERSAAINKNAEAVAELFLNSPLIKDIYYPSYLPSKKFYDQFKVPGGGYGGLLSLVFHDSEAAKVFFDTILCAKGPSLGTNFTLMCPYTILAHYAELEFVEKYGVDRNLIRISVGLEDTDALINAFKAGLKAVENVHS